MEERTTEDTIYGCRPLLRSTAQQFSARSNQLIREALRLAVTRLSDLRRYDGSPFVYHAIRTASIVTDEVGLGRNSVIATLIHDVSRLGRIAPSEIDEKFGPEVVTILEGLNNISEVDPKKEDDQIDNFKELILSYATDPRVILIKLADRLEVMRSLAAFPKEKQEKKSWETLNMYAQIAHKLGLYSIKSEMEDLSLRYMYPEEYGEITRKLTETDAERKDFIRRFLIPIEEKIRQAGITYQVKSRTKSVYSIWRKMKKIGVAFEEVYDVFALRFIIDCPRELEKQYCWNIYSFVTDFYTPNPDRMRDWISIPKSNGYESLHATVVTPEGKWVEVQIRTEWMDEVAERGVAAHWRYKGVKQSGLTSEQWLEKLREVMETAETAVNISKKVDVAISSKEIFVFTPNGDLRKLPEGAVVLDFAFDIHTTIGTHCTGARINHKVVSIREKLKNGDVVEIITSKNQKPKPEWLHLVTTGKARQRIKSFLREENAKAANIGRETLERKIKNWKLSLTIDDAVNQLCRHYKLKTGTELYRLISGQKIALNEIKNILTGQVKSAVEEKPKGQGRTKKTAPSEECLIIDDTLRNVSYKFGKCCNPIFGDDIFGFVTVSAGITIHRTDCPNGTRMLQRYPYRVLPAKWRNDVVKGAFRASIRVQAEDNGGLLNQIAEAINNGLKINIRSMNLNSSGGILSGLINIEVTSTQMVDTVIHHLLRIKGVQKVFRVNN